MEKKSEDFPVDGCGVNDGPPYGEATNETSKNSFAIIEPEAVSRAQVADRILSRILADLAAMREIVVRAASVSMQDEARVFAQRDIENLKGDIARLTQMLSGFSVDELGMTAAEYAESMALIGRSIEEATGIVEKSRTVQNANAEPQAEEEALSKWFDRVTKRNDSEENEA